LGGRSPPNLLFIHVFSVRGVGRSVRLGSVGRVGRVGGSGVGSSVGPRVSGG